MQNDPFPPAEQTRDDLHPDPVAADLTPEEKAKPPEMSWAEFYGRKADDAVRQRRYYEERFREAQERRRYHEERFREALRDMQRMITRRRQRGHTDAEIAKDLGMTVEELLERYPIQD